jgi:hypothetical protein
VLCSEERRKIDYREMDFLAACSCQARKSGESFDHKRYLY